MTFIELHTHIKANVEQVFELSRDIDFHVQSATQTEESAIAGVTTGKIGLGETVTWRGRHFGRFLTHTSVISKLVSPRYFIDEMVSGHFRFFKHYHLFKRQGGHTHMTDIVLYKVPYGLLGELFNFFFLKPHLKKFLAHRNLALRKALEK